MCWRGNGSPARKAGVHTVPLWRIGNVQVQVDRLHGVGALVQQPFWKAIEQAIRATEHRSAIASNIPGEANARRKVEVLVLVHGRSHARIANEFQSLRCAGCDCRLKTRICEIETHQRTVQIDRGQPRVPTQSNIQRESRRDLPVILQVYRRTYFAKVETCARCPERSWTHSRYKSQPAHCRSTYTLPAARYHRAPACVDR